jgi:hypothetical protein
MYVIQVNRKNLAVMKEVPLEQIFVQYSGLPCQYHSTIQHFWEIVGGTKRYKHSLTQGPLSLYMRHRDTESVLMKV